MKFAYLAALALVSTASACDINVKFYTDRDCTNEQKGYQNMIDDWENEAKRKEGKCQYKRGNGRFTQVKCTDTHLVTGVYMDNQCTTPAKYAGVEIVKT